MNARWSRDSSCRRFTSKHSYSKHDSKGNGTVQRRNFPLLERWKTVCLSVIEKVLDQAECGAVKSFLNLLPLECSDPLPSHIDIAAFVDLNKASNDSGLVRYLGSRNYDIVLSRNYLVLYSGGFGYS